MKSSSSIWVLVPSLLLGDPGLSITQLRKGLSGTAGLASNPELAERLRQDPLEPQRFGSEGLLTTSFP